MKIKVLSTMVVIGAFLIPSLVYSADETLCQQGAYVFFGNGVGNNKKQADVSRLLLAQRLESRVSGTGLEGTMTYISAYNPSYGKLLDLMETFDQNLQTDISQFWRYLSGLDPMPDFLQNKLKEIANTVDKNILQSNPAVQEHVEKYNEFLGEGNKVVVVAHSQGNLFANMAYLGIDSQYIDSFGIVSVANPDSYVAGAGPYTTLTNDIVINAFSGSLPANVSNNTAGSDRTGHDFVNSYLNGDVTGPRIIGHILTTLENLATPDQPAEMVITCSSPPCDEITSSSSKQYSLDGAQGHVTWSVTGGSASIDQNGLLATDSQACGTVTITAKDSCGTFTLEVRVMDAGYWQWISTEYPDCNPFNYECPICSSYGCSKFNFETIDGSTKTQSRVFHWLNNLLDDTSGIHIKWGTDSNNCVFSDYGMDSRKDIWIRRIDNNPGTGELFDPPNILGEYTSTADSSGECVIGSVWWPSYTRYYEWRCNP